MNDTARCPMCPRGFETRTDLRVHLMCEHRKSALADELLVAVEADHDRARGETQPVSVLNH